MNNRMDLSDDILNRFMNGEKTEKAPGDFTSDVMARISHESVPVPTFKQKAGKNIIPIISSAITLMLIIIASLLPKGSGGEILQPVAGFIKSMDIRFPEISFTALSSLHIPVAAVYVITGIFFLGVLDYLFSGLFYRRNKS